MIVIVDYGMGNLCSVQNMFKYIGVKAAITSDPDEITKADKVVLPGVGAFDVAMERINAGPLRGVLDRKAMVDRVPVLGICLGMQLVTGSSEEGTQRGLGWIKGAAYRFQPSEGVKVPHMGWNTVIATRPSILSQNLPDDPRFYFVHSYYVRVENDVDCVFKAKHATTFDAAIERENVFGVQFHPEKSHKYGAQLLKNFALL